MCELWVSREGVPIPFHVCSRVTHWRGPTRPNKTYTTDLDTRNLYLEAKHSFVPKVCATRDGLDRKKFLRTYYSDLKRPVEHFNNTHQSPQVLDDADSMHGTRCDGRWKPRAGAHRRHFEPIRPVRGRTTRWQSCCGRHATLLAMARASHLRLPLRGCSETEGWPFVQVSARPVWRANSTDTNTTRSVRWAMLHSLEDTSSKDEKRFVRILLVYWAPSVKYLRRERLGSHANLLRDAHSLVYVTSEKTNWMSPNSWQSREFQQKRCFSRPTWVSLGKNES